MALRDLARSAALRTAAAVREGMALAAVLSNDFLSYLGAEQRERLAGLIGPGPCVLVTGDQVEGFRVDGTPLDLARPDPERRVSLRIEPQAVMRRQIEVPRAAAADLAAALPMNLETWTPFSEEDVYARAGTLPENRTGTTDATVRIEIRCVARRTVDDRIEALAKHGVTPDALQLGDATFELARPTIRRRAAQRRRRWLLALGALALVQVIFLHMLVAARQADQIAGLQAERERLTRALREKADHGQKASQARHSLRMIAAQFDADQSVSRALEILAATLPAEIHIREIALNRDRAEGTLILASARDLDVGGMLASTGLYKATEIAVDATSPDGPRLYAVTFALSGWIPNDMRSRR